MRSQLEIMMKLDEIKATTSPKDISWCMFVVILHKLEWKTAKGFLKETHQTEEHKKRWDERQRLDKAFLTRELKEEYLDEAAMHIASEDVELAALMLLKVFAHLWLFGPSKDKILGILWKEFLGGKAWRNGYDSLYKLIATEFEVDWERLKLRYKTGMFTKILDAQGKKMRLEGEEVDGTQVDN